MTALREAPPSRDRPPAAASQSALPPLLGDARAAYFARNRCGFLVLGADGAIQDADPRAREILTLHDRDMPSAIQDVMRPETRSRFVRLLGDLTAHVSRANRLDIEFIGPFRAMQFGRLEMSAHDACDNRVRHVLATLTDTTARATFELQRQREEKRLRATVDNVAVGIISTDWNGQFIEVNRQFARMLDYPVAYFAGRSFRDFMHPEDVTEHSERRAALWRGDIPSVTIDRRWIKRDGTVMWSRMTISVQDDLVDSEPYSVVILEDITEAKRVEESQALLVGELNHRVKNTLAVVQGIVRRTLATTSDPQTFANQIEDRLQSISRAHDLLSRNDWVELGLVDVIQTSVLDAFREHAPAIAVDAVNAQLSPHQAITLTLILHELATNAIKYGALSVETGRVQLTARIGDAAPNDDPDTQHQAVVLTWQESGGPPVRPAKQKGFGNFLLMRGANHSLNGTATLEYPETGIQFGLTFPLTNTPCAGSAPHSAPSAENHLLLKTIPNKTHMEQPNAL
jgi:PAS domain S-box-containing protein